MYDGLKKLEVPTKSRHPGARRGLKYGLIGLSILSGGHVLLVPDVIARLKDRGVDPSEVPVVVGGIIPEDDARALESAGVAKVYTPKDFDLTRIVGEIAGLVARAHKVEA